MDSEVHPISDAERDSLFSIPLSVLPLATPGLAAARLIKNARLETKIEMFTGEETGSGQLDIRDLPQQFGWSSGDQHPDMKVLKKLGALNSYDVYSLRLSLREMDVDVNDISALRLSAAKSNELAAYMGAFTRPLIEQIYGGDTTTDISSFEDVLALFRAPDVKKAMERLKQMADRLEVRPEQVPAFLEDCGDIFLAISYYRQCLDTIEPTITSFLDALRELRSSYQFREDRGLQELTREMESVLNEAMAGLTGRFEAFDRASSNLWENLSAERFRKVEKLVRGFHITNGGVLCSLWVKMTAWDQHFPNESVGSPAKRAEFLQVELKHGLEKIRKIERAAPKITDIN